MGNSRTKAKAREFRTFALVGKNPEILISLLLYPWNFRTKQSLTSEHSAKFCYKIMLHSWNSKTKKQGPCFTKNLLDLVISTVFLINPWNFHVLFVNTTRNCVSSTSLFFFIRNNPMNGTNIACIYQSKITPLHTA